MSRCCARLHLPNLSKFSHFFPQQQLMQASSTSHPDFCHSLLSGHSASLIPFLLSTQPSEVSFKIINHITSLLFSKPSSSSHLSQGQTKVPSPWCISDSIQSSPLLPFWPLPPASHPRHTHSLYSWNANLFDAPGLCQTDPASGPLHSPFFIAHSSLWLTLSSFLLKCHPLREDEPIQRQHYNVSSVVSSQKDLAKS